jgi:Ca2+-binding EF-hand superfamily protein
MASSPPPACVTLPTPREECAASRAERAAVYELFQRFDRNGDGVIDARELPSLVAHLGDSVTDEELRALKGIGSCSITFPAFMAFWELPAGRRQIRTGGAGGAGGGKGKKVVVSTGAAPPASGAAAWTDAPAPVVLPAPPTGVRAPRARVALPPLPPILRHSRDNLFAKLRDTHVVPESLLSDQRLWTRCLLDNVALVFAHYDSSRDGVLQPDELRHMLYEMLAAQHKAVGARLEAEGVNVLGEPLVAAALTAAAAEDASSQSVQRMIKDVIRRFDKNRDGNLSQAELAEYFAIESSELRGT